MCLLKLVLMAQGHGQWAFSWLKLISIGKLLLFDSPSTGMLIYGLTYCTNVRGMIFSHKKRAGLY
jgi:hypothetical protein